MKNIEKLKNDVKRYIEDNASWLFEGENIDKDKYIKKFLEEIEQEEIKEAELRAERTRRKKIWSERTESKGILTR